MIISRSIAAFIVLLSATVSLQAQWLHYPTPGIPERLTARRTCRPRYRGPRRANRTCPEFG